MLRLTDSQLSWCFANFFFGSMYTLKRHFFFGGKMIIYLPFDEFQTMIVGVLKKQHLALITLYHGKDLQQVVIIWVFPKMVVPPNHPF